MEIPGFGLTNLSSKILCYLLVFDNERFSNIDSKLILETTISFILSTGRRNEAWFTCGTSILDVAISCITRYHSKDTITAERVEASTALLSCMTADRPSSECFKLRRVAYDMSAVTWMCIAGVLKLGFI